MLRSSNTGTALAVTMVVATACPMLARAAVPATDNLSASEAPTSSDTSAGGTPSPSPDSATPETSGPSTDSSNIPAVVISAQKLNEARAGIETKTGASTYTINADAIQAIPGGDNALLNQVILRAPDVAQDSFGQLHVRGEHNGLQYRLNGIILPEGISVFGQTLDPRLVESMKLIMGALPAEYGLRTAGIIDLTTKSGVIEPHGEISIYGGSHNEIQPSFFHGGSAGPFNYFVTGDFLRNNLGIEAPDRSTNPLHDETTQYHAFGYFEYLLGEQDRLSWILGTSHEKFQIPNQSGLMPSLGLTVNGQTDFPSEDLNENQTESTHYAILSYQHSQDEFDIQSSLTARYSSLTFFPDPVGSLLYNGVSQDAFKRDVAYSWQTDSAYHLGDAHTVRAGFYVQRDKATSRTTSQVLPAFCDGAGTVESPYLCQPYNNNPLDPLYNQQFDQPFPVIDNSDATQTLESVYLQDEWKILEPLVLNYGLRFDHVSAYTSAHQVSPRVNLVWTPLEGMTVHGGYSRYFSPPPFELVGTKTISKFLNTTNAPGGGILAADPPLPEKANYYDVGIEQHFPVGVTVGLDSYYKQSRNLVDEGQFGAPIILTPFNYRYGEQYGVELTSSYTTKNFSVYANLATQRARGKQFETAQFNFSPEDLTYVSAHYISLDHEQQYTASAGASYRWHYTRFSSDILFGSGLRAALTLPDGTTIPNGTHLPYYRQVNLGITQDLPFLVSSDAKDVPRVRFDVVNVFDTVYQIRNGTGVGVGAPQYGARRGYFIGVAWPF
jgi:outer membrane receptor protein involved in Fe transport